MLNLVYTCLLLSLKPYYSKSHQSYEIVNEITILLISTIIFLFSGEFVEDEKRLGIGISLIVITVISFLIGSVPFLKLVKKSICRIGILYKKRKDKKKLRNHLIARTPEELDYDK